MKFFFFLIILLSSMSVKSQSRNAELHQILDTLINRSKDISYYRTQVNWDSLSTAVHDLAKESESIDDLKPAFTALINGLGDPHGTIRKTSDFSILGYFTDRKNSPNQDNRPRDQEIWQTVNNPDSRFEYALLDNHVGYLKVVGIGPQIDGQKEANRIRAAINELNKEKVDKWIVDLRYNGGGNINVMMAGLAPLFDTTAVASIQGPNGENAGEATIKKGDFYYFEMRAFNMKRKPKIKNPKIAVLLSRWTVSSGELVATALKGQKNTKFFGEYTQGLTTNNSWEIVNNEVALIISTGVYCDRHGTAYPVNIPVDEEVVFKVETDPKKDEGISRASEWLNRPEQ